MLEILEKLDSITKYYSIENFHEQEKGRVIDKLTETGQKILGRTDLCISEKIDGTNCREIILRENVIGANDWDWLIGSRDELLMARGDRIADPYEGIAKALLYPTEKIMQLWQENPEMFGKDTGIVIIYKEFYGGKIGRGAKNYSRDGSVGFRIFDLKTISQNELRMLLKLSREEIALKREKVGIGNWFSKSEIIDFCIKIRFQNVPVMSLAYHEAIPEDIKETYQWLKRVAGEKTRVSLENNEPGRPEGVVVQTLNRSIIVKLKFAEYERALGLR